MSTHDPISDLITRIRNAQMRNKSKVSTPGSKMRANVLEVLKSEGYIRGYTRVELKGEAPQWRKLPRPSCFLLGVLIRYYPQHYHYAKTILPVCYRD